MKKEKHCICCGCPRNVLIQNSTVLIHDCHENISVKFRILCVECFLANIGINDSNIVDLLPKRFKDCNKELPVGTLTTFSDKNNE